MNNSRSLKKHPKLPLSFPFPFSSLPGFWFDSSLLGKDSAPTSPSHGYMVIVERSGELQTHGACKHREVLGLRDNDSKFHSKFNSSLLLEVYHCHSSGSFGGTVSLFLVKSVFTSFIDCIQGAAVSGPNFIPRDNKIGLRSESAQSMRTAMLQEPVVLLMSPQLSLVLMAIIALKNTKGCH